MYYYKYDDGENWGFVASMTQMSELEQYTPLTKEEYDSGIAALREDVDDSWLEGMIDVPVYEEER